MTIERSEGRVFEDPVFRALVDACMGRGTHQDRMAVYKTVAGESLAENLFEEAERLAREIAARREN